MILNLGNRVVNNYLLTGEDGHVLIDTGYERGFRGFRKKLAKAKIDPDIIYPAHGKPFKTADLKKYAPYLDRIRLFPLKRRQ